MHIIHEQKSASDNKGQKGISNNAERERERERERQVNA